jgi:hypothetical protein
MKLTPDHSKVRLAAKPTVDHLKEIARKIKHGPDYGDLFWNPVEGKVHYVMGDAHDDSCTPSDEIQKMLEDPGEVGEVIIGDEYFPDKEDPNWQKIEYRD